jgi:hypothetical protein
MDDFPFSEEKVNKDKKIVERLKNKWRQEEGKRRGKELSDEEFEKIINKKRGVIFEKLKVVLFNKHLGEYFICTRTSEYDDYVNGVDNIIVSKKTGKVVAAVDVVSDSLDEVGRRSEEKKEQAYKTNLNGGANVDYGFTIEGDTIKLTSCKEVPIFCLELSAETVFGTLEHFGSPEKERKALRRLLGQMKEQLEKLNNLETPKKESQFWKNLSSFEQELQQVKF